MADKRGFTVEIHRDLYKRLKIGSIITGKTIRGFVIEAINDKLAPIKSQIEPFFNVTKELNTDLAQ